MKHFNLYATNFPPAKKPEEVRAYLQSLAATLDIVTKEEKADGSLYCLLEAACETAFDEFTRRNGAEWDGYSVEIRTPKYEEPVNRKVNVVGFAMGTTREELEPVFEQFGVVESVTVISKTDKSFAFVVFESEEARAKALAMSGRVHCNGRNLQIREIKKQEQARWSLEELNRQIEDLGRRVHSDVNYKSLEKAIKKAQGARQILFGDGDIGLADSVKAEALIQQLWDVKKLRLDRACKEFENDLSSVEENVSEMIGDWATWEGFDELAKTLIGIHNHLASLDLPTDRDKAFGHRIRRARAAFIDLWIKKVEAAYASLEKDVGEFRGCSKSDDYAALSTFYQRLRDVKESLIEFVGMVHNPPLALPRQDTRTGDLLQREQGLWNEVNLEVKHVIEKMKAKGMEIVNPALDTFFLAVQEKGASLRYKRDQLEELKQLIADTGVMLPREKWSMVREAESLLTQEITGARKEFLQQVAQLEKDAPVSPDPEALLEQVKTLQEVKRTIPLERHLSQVQTSLNVSRELLNNRVEEKHRIVSEHYSNEIDKVQQSFDTQSSDNLSRVLKGLSDRVGRGRLSHRWKAVLQTQISQLFGRLRDRQNRARQEAVDAVQAVEELLQGDAEMSAVRAKLKEAQDWLHTLDLPYGVRDDLDDRLARVRTACDQASDTVAAALEPQVAECERLAADGRFDRVFAEINRLQQEISRVGIARTLWLLRERLNQAWQQSQQKQEQTAELWESLMTERIAACERLAKTEDYFTETIRALQEAKRTLESRPCGLRGTSKSSSEYEAEILRVRGVMNHRAREIGDGSKVLIEKNANKIRKMLTAGGNIAGIFHELHQLNRVKRVRWKNQADMPGLDALVSLLWEDAKILASKERASACDSANKALERCRFLAQIWFDWTDLQEELQNTGNLIRSLQLPREFKEQCLVILEGAKNVARIRQKNDHDNAFTFDWLVRRHWYCRERGMVTVKNQRWSESKKMNINDLSERDLFILSHIYDVAPTYCTDLDGNPFPGIEYDEKSLDYVMFQKFRLSENWYQPFTRIRIEFPKSYPHTPPIGWYMDKDLNLRGWQAARHYFPERAFHGAEARPGWAWYCCQVKPINQPGGWHPSTWNNPRLPDNLWSFLEVIKTALGSNV